MPPEGWLSPGPPWSHVARASSPLPLRPLRSVVSAFDGPCRQRAAPGCSRWAPDELQMGS
eukprot:7380820-Prymnesium_polylepis.1